MLGVQLISQCPECLLHGIFNTSTWSNAHTLVGIYIPLYVRAYMYIDTMYNDCLCVVRIYYHFFIGIYMYIQCTFNIYCIYSGTLEYRFQVPNTNSWLETTEKAGL